MAKRQAVDKRLERAEAEIRALRIWVAALIAAEVRRRAHAQ